MSDNKEADYRSHSFWLDSVPGSLQPCAPLQGSQQAEIAIIGAGYTGLWTAYYLKKHAPHLDIAILEAEIAGFGASGRNGGWASAYLSGLETDLENPDTRADAIEMHRMMFDTVNEVGRITQSEGIDCHYSKSGHVATAVNAAQLQDNREYIDFMHEIGFGDDDYRWLEPDELQSRVNIESALGGYFTPHCAAIHPARLARGLAGVLRTQGVRIYENSPVTAMQGSTLQCPGGTLDGGTVLLATEGYTDSLPGVQRKLIPVHSTMIATEPLSAEEIEATGLSHRTTWNNSKHLVTYGQLTADGRIAFGSRGRYLFGSGIQQNFPMDDPLFEIVRNELAQIFPILRGKAITHAWGGAMGVSRSLRPAVCYDGATRTGWAGGFFGDGVAATNLAGRTLADLVLQRDTARCQAMWVNPEREKSLVRRLWEPEPWRWVGINTRARLMGWADQAEAADSRLAPLANRVLNWFPS